MSLRAYFNNELFAKIKIYNSLYMDSISLLLMMQATLFMNRIVLVNVNAA